MNAAILQRFGHALHRRGLTWLAWLTYPVIFLLYNSSIPPTVVLGRGTKFMYQGIGVVVHHDAQIGSNTVIGQGVTIGASEPYTSSVAAKCPRIGDDVFICVGARILGDIRIGNRVVIGAGAVVLKDVPDEAIVAGVPARVIGKTGPDYKAIRP
jgi:serine O-acetyltransferase